MTVRLKTENSCAFANCLRPAREPGRICSQHWRGLAPETRAVLSWEASWELAFPVIPDPLEALYARPAYRTATNDSGPT